MRGGNVAISEAGPRCLSSKIAALSLAMTKLYFAGERRTDVEYIGNMPISHRTIPLRTSGVPTKRINALYQSIIFSCFDRVGSGVYIQFQIDIFYVAAYGLQIDKKLLGYLAAAFTLGNEFQYLRFAFG